MRSLVRWLGAMATGLALVGPVGAAWAEGGGIPEEGSEGASLWEEGFALYRAGDYGAAASRLERLVEADPGDVPARLYLADCYERLGQPGRALELETRAKEERRSAAEFRPKEVEAIKDGEDRPAAPRRSHRSGRLLGVGMSLLGPSGTVGLFAEVLPLPFLAGEVGWGFGIGRIQSWWAEVKLVPAPGAWSPFVGAGVLGLFGVVKDIDYEALGPAGEALLSRELHAYATAGLMLMTRKGFSCQFAVGFAWTGVLEYPVFVMPGYRMSWHF
ncbi:tetratricopeptide repeat protein [Myxococcota bacterium]|nr:tetratricopeptide repeat protein [Myxococcota bacterium]